MLPLQIRLATKKDGHFHIFSFFFPPFCFDLFFYSFLLIKDIEQRRRQKKKNKDNIMMNFHLMLYFLLHLYSLGTNPARVAALINEPMVNNGGVFPTQCPMPYTMVSDTFISTNGMLYNNPVRVNGSGNLDLPGVTFGSLQHPGFFDLNLNAVFVDPLTGGWSTPNSLYLNAKYVGVLNTQNPDVFNARDHILWPDLNVPFQNPSVKTSNVPAANLTYLYTRQGIYPNDVGSVEWVPLGYNPGGFSVPGVCIYKGYIDNTPANSADFEDEMARDLFTLTGAGILNGTWDMIYNVYQTYSTKTDRVSASGISNDNVWFDRRRGFRAGLRHMRNTAVIIIAYQLSLQTIANYPQYGTGVADWLTPKIYCLNDWTGPDCNIPLMFEKDTTLPGSPTRCGNVFPQGPLSPSCSNLVPSSTKTCTLPIAFNDVNNTCACLSNFNKTDKDDQMFEIYKDLFPYFLQSSNPSSFNCSTCQVRGVPDMIAAGWLQPNGGIPTHFCDRLITNGIPDSSFTSYMYESISSPGVLCAAANSKGCTCSSRFGGLNCSIDLDYYCGAHAQSYMSPSNLPLPNAGCSIPNYKQNRSSQLFTSMIPSSLDYALQCPSGHTAGAVSTTFYTPIGFYPPFDAIAIGLSCNPLAVGTDNYTFPASVFLFGGSTIYYQPSLVYSMLPPPNPWIPLTVPPIGSGICVMDENTFCAFGPGNLSENACRFSSTVPDTYVNLETIGCYECGPEFYGRDCSVTCVNPSCPIHATCINLGGAGWSLNSNPVSVKCMCNSGYVDALPSTQTIIEGCVTCINELGRDVPLCGGNSAHGTCPLIAWTSLGPSHPLTCVCNASYVDQSCQVPSTVSITCGAHPIVFLCVFQGLGTASPIDYRYTCTANQTLLTGTSPNQAYPVQFFCPNVPLIQNYDSVASASIDPLGVHIDSSGSRLCQAIQSRCLLPSSTNSISSSVSTSYINNNNIPNSICPLPFLTFQNIGQSSSSFCDPPLPAIQYLQATFYNITLLCYMLTQIPILVSNQMYPFTAIYRCVSPYLHTVTPQQQISVQQLSLVSFQCDLLLDWNSLVAQNPVTLGGQIVSQCVLY